MPGSVLIWKKPPTINVTLSFPFSLCFILKHARVFVNMDGLHCPLVLIHKTTVFMSKSTGFVSSSKTSSAATMLKKYAAL